MKLQLYDYHDSEQKIITVILKDTKTKTGRSIASSNRKRKALRRLTSNTLQASYMNFTELKTLTKAPVHSPVGLILDLLNLYVKNQNTIDDWTNYQLAYEQMQSKLEENEYVVCWVYVDANGRFLGLYDESISHWLPGGARVATPNDNIFISKIKIAGTNLPLPNYTLDEEVAIVKAVYDTAPHKIKNKEEAVAHVTNLYNNKETSSPNFRIVPKALSIE